MIMMQSRYSLTLGLTIVLMSGCGESSTQTTSTALPPTSSTAPATPAEPPAAKPSSPIASEPQGIPTPKQEAPAAVPEAAVGSGAKSAELQLAQNSGCLACHSVDKKVVGPAWRDVAARYRNDPGAQTRLVAKVSEGGKGNWTDVTGGVGMPPYGSRVKAENIAQLVQFILSLK